MRICSNCHIHNLASEKYCHSCGTLLEKPTPIPWKTAVLLGVVSSGCLSQKTFTGEPEYGVAMIDQDGDGYFEGMDCDDSNPEIGEPSNWYVDNDKDGFGDSNDLLFECTQPQGYVENDSDCNDEDDSVHPDASETPGDTVDSNCNGEDDT